MPRLHQNQHGSNRSDCSAPNTAELLFINKDATNLTRTPAEIYAVGSYVSKGSRKWKRTKSSLDLDPSTGRILSDSLGLESSAVPLDRSPPNSGRPITLRWRIGDGRVTSMKSIDRHSITRSSDKIVKSATSSPKTPVRPSCTMDHPSTSNSHGKSIRSFLAYYFSTIRPFVLTIRQDWIWICDLASVVSSPALTYAICAFSSAFQVSVEKGLHELVLPPANGNICTALWPAPDWFVFQAQAISLLRRHLANTTNSQRPMQKAELHAMLFLMRLFVLIGDRESALMHLNAIRLATEEAAIMPDLHVDIAVWKVNLPMAYFHRQQLSVRPYLRASNPSWQQPILDLDTSTMTDDNEWRRARAFGLNRKILWRPVAPQEMDPDDGPYGLVCDFLQNEARLQTFNDEIKQEVVICLQIARYLSAHLRYLNADTAQPKVRNLVCDLRCRLSQLMDWLGASGLRHAIPRPILYAMFIGVLASQGYEDDEKWFLRRINNSNFCGSISGIDDFREMLAMFLDLDTINPELLKHIMTRISAQDVRRKLAHRQSKS